MLENLDMMTDDELVSLKLALQARQMRIRTMVMSKRMDRTEYDHLASQVEAVNAELADRGLLPDGRDSGIPF